LQHLRDDSLSRWRYRGRLFFRKRSKIVALTQWAAQA